MTKRYLPFLFLALFSQLFGSCELVEGIFKAGVWVGVLIVVAVIGLIVWILSRLGGSK